MKLKTTLKSAAKDEPAEKVSPLTVTLKMFEGLVKRVERLEIKAMPKALPDPDEDYEEPPPERVKFTAEEKEHDATLPEDAHRKPLPPGLTYDTKSSGWTIETDLSANWTPPQMVEAARLLKQADLSEYLGQPRELRRLLTEMLPEAFPDLVERIPKPAQRAAVKLNAMPTELTTGKDGLPTASPTIGRHPGKDALKEDDSPVPEHLDREDWDTSGKMLKLHLIAEEFRSTVVGAKRWECQGYNCHDCVELDKAIDSIAVCTEYFEDNYKSFEFEFPKGASLLAVKVWQDYVKEREAKK